MLYVHTNLPLTQGKQHFLPHITLTIYIIVRTVCFAVLELFHPLRFPVLNIESANFQQTHHIIMLSQAYVMPNAKAWVNGNSQLGKV